MEKIKLGIIGTNFVSDWMADATNVSDIFSPFAVLSRTEEKGASFAERHNIPNVFTDETDFLKSDIDAVYIASPNCFHCVHALSALSHGKHVICEKPISSNLREFESMVSAAEKNGLVLLEAMRPAHDPALTAVRKALPRIGKVRRAAFEFCQYSSRYDRYRGGEILRAFDPSYSNAAVMDIGVYPIHFCLRLFGRPQRIKSSSVMLENGFEGAGCVILIYGDMSAVVSYSKICDSVLPSVIEGEDGSITIDKMSCPHEINLIPRGGEAEKIEFSYRSDNMVFELEEFGRLIRAGKFHHEHTEFSRMEMEILDEIRFQAGIVFPADDQTI